MNEKQPISPSRVRAFTFHLLFLALEETSPDEAIQLYTDACAILEEDGKEQMAFDLYRAITSIYIKLQKQAVISYSQQKQLKFEASSW
ncbi:Gamma-soluble NSF attachment protein-like protein [Drosera capensis]